MAQAYYPIQQALDTQLLTVGGISQWAANNTSGNFFAENQTFSLANIANPSGLVFVRSTLIPVSPVTSTLGIGGYDELSGVYAIDVMGQLDKGFATVKQMADTIIAAFPRGSQLTLPNSAGQITVETTGMAPNITQGAWAMNKLYCVQVQVKWFGYFAP